MEKTSEERVLNFLKKEGESSASKISVVLGINWYKLERILALLISENKILFEQKSKGNYYKVLKEKKK
jgi:predicted HTH transcriptional regulator